MWILAGQISRHPLEIHLLGLQCQQTNLDGDITSLGEGNK